MKKLFTLVLSLFGSVMIVSAQPRPVEKSTAPTSTVAKANRTILPSVEARYEGGIFGYNEREKGTIKFDDENERLVFLGKDNGKELFSIPYKSILVVSPNSRKIQSGAGRAVGSAPILGAGIAGSFMKKKKNYLVIQYRDPDVDVQGLTSFLIDTDELLEKVIYSLGEKAKMTPRGDAYYRPSERKTIL